MSTQMAPVNGLQKPNDSQQSEDFPDGAPESYHGGFGDTVSITHLTLEELIELEEESQEENILDWAKEESPSFEPKLTATSPEVCLWATTKAIADDYEWIMNAAAEEVIGEGVPRIASCMRRAVRHLYTVPNSYDILFPPKAMGFKEVDKYMYFLPFGQRKPGPYRLGCKGFKHENDPEIPVISYIPNGMRSDCAGPYNTHFYPQPSSLNQVCNVDDYDSIDHIDSLTHERNDSLTQLDGTPPQYQTQGTSVKAVAVSRLKDMPEDDDMPLPNFAGDNDQYHGPTKEYSGNVTDSDSDSDDLNETVGPKAEVVDAAADTEPFVDFDGDHADGHVK